MDLAFVAPMLREIQLSSKPAPSIAGVGEASQDHWMVKG
jgi:hypothetical protein